MIICCLIKLELNISIDVQDLQVSIVCNNNYNE